MKFEWWISERFEVMPTIFCAKKQASLLPNVVTIYLQCVCVLSKPKAQTEFSLHQFQYAKNSDPGSEAVENILQTDERFFFIPFWWKTSSWWSTTALLLCASCTQQADKVHMYLVNENDVAGEHEIVSLLRLCNHMWSSWRLFSAPFPGFC